MALASEIIARAHEGKISSFGQMTAKELVSEFSKLDQELGLLALLKGLNASDARLSAKRNALLIFTDSAKEPEIRSYRDATEAIQALFDFEKANPGKDVVLVRASSSEEVRTAFRNYFNDAREFIRLIEDGCHRLIYSADEIKRKNPA